ncbi:redoxin domain-containing protein [bacterium]|nr:redoxin domain-containing protein [bacterium]
MISLPTGSQPGNRMTGKGELQYPPNPRKREKFTICVRKWSPSRVGALMKVAVVHRRAIHPESPIMRIATKIGSLAILLALAGATMLPAEPETAAAASSTAVYESAEVAQPLKVGASLPAVPELKDAQNNAVNLAETVNGKTTVLIFYRGGWCPYCNTHLGDLARVQPDLAADGVQIVAISPDSPATLAKHLEKKPLPYTLLSDSDHKAMEAFGVAFTVDGATQKKLKGYGIDLEQASGSPDPILPVPSVFVLDKEGKIVYTHSDPNYKKRLSAKEVVEATKLAAAPVAAENHAQ